MPFLAQHYQLIARHDVEYIARFFGDDDLSAFTDFHITEQVLAAWWGTDSRAIAIERNESVERCPKRFGD